MKVLLRHRHIGLYYAGGQRWVGDPEEAIDFREVERASLHKRESSMPETEVVVGDPDPLCGYAATPMQLSV
jgi:hypothetical protein